MDTPSAATYIARSEARRIRAFWSVDDLDEADDEAFGGAKKLPAFRVTQSAGQSAGRLVAQPLNDRHPTHDNAARLDQVCRYLNSNVLPMIEPGQATRDVQGYYRVELHDSYSYLPDRASYADVFSFGRELDAPERRVALLPDPYHMDNFGGGQLVGTASSDPVRWQDKKPVILFAGTTTGDRDPARNARLRACAWGALHRPEATRMYITSVAQMKVADIQAAYPDPALLRSIFRPYVPMQEHFEYRYVANVVGNTACWSRVPMIMSSGSVMVHVRHEDATWYYPLLREGRHYVGAQSVEAADLERALSFCRSYDRQCRHMVTEANALSRELFGDTAVINTYTSELLQEVGYLHGA